MNKMHRNGEKTPPTEPGVYRFFGKCYGRHLGAKDIELYVVDHELIGIHVFMGTIHEGIELYEGRWWGPVRPL